ncbi:MAG: dUTP diphosphatase [Magnetococcales bacterium]|nr:dUTP diphosphatase [Magnetococcales bacterium]
MKIPTKITHRNAVLPERQYPDDAGSDLRSIETRVLGVMERHLFHTGIHLEIPEGHCGMVIPRSGFAAEHGVTVLNAPGLIDADFRGEVLVNLINLGHGPVKIQAGDRIAQLVVIRYERPAFVNVLELSKTRRGEASHGSTGTR